MKSSRRLDRHRDSAVARPRMYVSLEAAESSNQSHIRRPHSKHVTYSCICTYAAWPRKPHMLGWSNGESYHWGGARRSRSPYLCMTDRTVLRLPVLSYSLSASLPFSNSFLFLSSALFSLFSLNVAVPVGNKCYLFIGRAEFFFVQTQSGCEFVATFQDNFYGTMSALNRNVFVILIAIFKSIIITSDTFNKSCISTVEQLHRIWNLTWFTKWFFSLDYECMKL